INLYLIPFLLGKIGIKMKQFFVKVPAKRFKVICSQIFQIGICYNFFKDCSRALGDIGSLYHSAYFINLRLCKPGSQQFPGSQFTTQRFMILIIYKKAGIVVKGCYLNEKQVATFNVFM